MPREICKLMRVTLKTVLRPEEEQVVIECVEVTKEVKDIEAYALSAGAQLCGYEGDRMYRFPLAGVYYFEAVDEHCFAYTKQHVFLVKMRLYALENAYRGQYFVRCSKAVLLNLMKLDSLSPARNGRFTAHLKNGEKIVISRQYAGELKKAVWEGLSREV